MRDVSTTTARLTLFALAALAASAGGCKKANSTATPTPIPAAPAEPPGTLNRWSDEQITETVKESLNLTTVTLARAGEEGAFTKYTGTGRDAQGAAVPLTVKYRAGELIVDYEVTENGRTKKKYE